MAVIGFMTYDDFRNEIRDAGVKTVRMQDYIKRQVNSVGITELRFWVELAAANGEDVYVARFLMGSGWNIPADEERAKLDRAQENAERAMAYLRRDLEALGVAVRPGVVTEAHETRIETCAPWRWEKDEAGLPVLVV